MTATTDPTLARRTALAGQQLFDGICAALADGRGVHLETAVAAAGQLAGAALLANAGVDLGRHAPGDYVIVEKVNELGPMVLDALFALVDNADGGPAARAPMASSVPPEHRPHQTFAELIPRVAPVMRQVTEANDIAAEMAPFVAARAAAQLILAGRGQVDVSITKAIAADAMVVAAKTIPPRG